MDIPEAIGIAIRNTRGEAFFAAIEQYFDSSIQVIPDKLKKILTLQGFDNAILLSKLNKKAIEEIEMSMKTISAHFVFKSLSEIESYYGAFTNCRSEFDFLVGERMLLKMINKIVLAAMRMTDQLGNTNENADEDDGPIIHEESFDNGHGAENFSDTTENVDAYEGAVIYEESESNGHTAGELDGSIENADEEDLVVIREEPEELYTENEE